MFPTSGLRPRHSSWGLCGPVPPAAPRARIRGQVPEGGWKFAGRDRFCYFSSGRCSWGWTKATEGALMGLSFCYFSQRSRESGRWWLPGSIQVGERRVDPRIDRRESRPSVRAPSCNSWAGRAHSGGLFLGQWGVFQRRWKHICSISVFSASCFHNV